LKQILRQHWGPKIEALRASKHRCPRSKRIVSFKREGVGGMEQRRGKNKCTVEINSNLVQQKTLSKPGERKYGGGKGGGEVKGEQKKRARIFSATKVAGAW